MQQTLRQGIRSLNTELLQSYAFLARNWHLTKRYWAWDVVWLLYSLTSGLAVVFICIRLRKKSLGHPIST